VRYQIVAEAYRDLEVASGRLQMIERLAELFRQTPDDLLPTVALLCQGQIAPDFAGVELGMADRLAARAVAQAAGAPAEQVLAGTRDTGDLRLTAERLLGELDPDRAATLEVATVYDGLHEIAQAEGTGSQGRKLGGLVGLLEQATPLEARYLLRTVTGNLRLGIGTATILDALAEVHAGGRKQRQLLERAYNICSDLSLVAATLVSGGLAAVEAMEVRAGNPVRPMLAQRMSSSAEILAKLGGTCAAEYKYDGIRVQAHRTADGALELYTRRLDRVSTQFPEVVELLDQSLRPREVILEGELVAADPASGELRPFQDVMFRRRKYGINEAVSDFPVSLFCFELLYADGTDLTRLPYLERRARLADAITPSERLRLATAEQVDEEAALERVFEAAVAEGCEGLICKSVNPAVTYQAGPGAGHGSSSSATTAASSATPSTWSWWAGWPGGAGAPGCTGRCCWPSTTRPASGSRRSASAAPASATPSWPPSRPAWPRWPGPSGRPRWTHSGPPTCGSSPPWWSRSWPPR
jgi:DNA ligase-1